jgi:hypothetical protein
VVHLREDVDLGFCSLILAKSIFAFEDFKCDLVTIVVLTELDLRCSSFSECF